MKTRSLLTKIKEVFAPLLAPKGKLIFGDRPVLLFLWLWFQIAPIVNGLSSSFSLLRHGGSFNSWICLLESMYSARNLHVYRYDPYLQKCFLKLCKLVLNLQQSSTLAKHNHRSLDGSIAFFQRVLKFLLTTNKTESFTLPQQTEPIKKVRCLELIDDWWMVMWLFGGQTMNMYILMDRL